MSLRLSASISAGHGISENSCPLDRLSSSRFRSPSKIEMLRRVGLKFNKLLRSVRFSSFDSQTFSLERFRLVITSISPPASSASGCAANMPASPICPTAAVSRASAADNNSILCGSGLTPKERALATSKRYSNSCSLSNSSSALTAASS